MIWCRTVWGVTRTWKSYWKRFRLYELQQFYFSGTAYQSVAEYTADSRFDWTRKRICKWRRWRGRSVIIISTHPLLLYFSIAGINPTAKLFSFTNGFSEIEKLFSSANLKTYSTLGNFSKFLNFFRRTPKELVGAFNVNLTFMYFKQNKRLARCLTCKSRVVHTCMYIADISRSFPTMHPSIF